MRNLHCQGDYELQERWLKDHAKADTIIYDKSEDLPAFAVYVNPVYQSYVTDPKRFFAKVAALMQEARNGTQT